MKLLSIPKEAAACRAAFAAAPDAIYAWHLHHEQLIEPLTEPAANRIAYILRGKPKEEQALRLRLFRPASSEAASARAAYNKAIASAWAAYAKATAPARAARDKAIASAWAAYAKATAPARAARDKVIAPAHEAECHDCPWTGSSIFAGSK